MCLLQTAYTIDNQPSVVRYPRGTGYGLDKLNSLFGYELDEMPAKGEELEIGKGRIVRRPRTTARQKAVILSIGTRLAPALEAAKQLEVGRSGRTVCRRVCCVCSLLHPPVFYCVLWLSLLLLLIEHCPLPQPARLLTWFPTLQCAFYPRPLTLPPLA